MAEKATRMLTKANWQCPRCLKKIKEIFGEYPQIRDQIDYEKQNAVLITVVRCSPEKIRHDIKRKGGKFVESVGILPDKYTRKPKKVFIELPEETAKTRAPGLVPAPPRKATKVAPLKPTQQAPALSPPKELELVVGYPPVPVHPMELVYPMEPVYPMVPPSYGGYGGGLCYWGRRRPVMGALMDVGDQLMSVGLGIEVPIQGRGDERRAMMDVKVGIEAMMDLEARLMSVKVGIEVPIQGRNRGGQRFYDGRGRPDEECQGGNRGCYPGRGRQVMLDDGCGRPASERQGGNRGYNVREPT